MHLPFGLDLMSILVGMAILFALHHFRMKRASV